MNLIRIKIHEIKLGDLIPWCMGNSSLGLVIDKDPVTILFNTMQIKVLNLETINIYVLNLETINIYQLKQPNA